MRTRNWAALTALLLGLLAPLAVQAQGDAIPTDTPPVAVISLVWGEVTIKHPNGDYKPARWLEPIYPQDYLKTNGPGAKLLITYFFDNHQEVLSPDSEAQADYKTLNSTSGPAIRKDKSRNPFGTGVANPFVYTHRLETADFENADAPGQMDLENTWLKASVKPSYPPVFTWAGDPKGKYKIQLFDTTKQFVGGATVTGTRFKASPKELSAASKGSTFLWQVTTPDDSVVVARYPFMVLTNPLEDWLASFRKPFQAKMKSGKLERSDYTDYLLVSAQLNQMDAVLSLCQQMAAMDGKNPRVFRALTRAYLAKGCPAHAKQAYDTQIELGGVDPILP